MSETVSATKSVAQKLAHVIRIVTVPPVMVAILIILLFTLREGVVFATTAEMVVSLTCLSILPILAYPLSVVIPAIKRKGRDGQRSLAMYISGASYLAVFVYGFAAGVGHNLMLVYTGYFMSVVILLVANKLFHVRASGHACSVSGPLVYTAYFLGIWGIAVGVALWGVILWASLAMKRHTLVEFILGTLTCLVSFGTALIFFH